MLFSEPKASSKGQLDSRLNSGQVFTEIELIGVTAGVWAGAWFALDIPLPVGLVGVILAVVVRQKPLMAIALVVLASSLGAQAEHDYHRALESGYVEGTVVIVSDTRPLRFGSSVEATLEDGRRVELLGFGALAFELEKATVGSSLVVSGTLRSVEDRPWLKARHIVGRVAVDSAQPGQPASVWKRPPEWIRAVVFNGSDVLSESDQALYTGLVVGDDRFQTADQKAQFQAAGLTHLLAVSGQNVAFVLAVLSPLLLRLRRWMRWFVVVVALVLFAFVTRAEPSVLRATVSVGFATSLTILGLKASGIRILALATMSLMLVDPFLAHSVGFQLSVAASAGILVIGPALQDMQRMPAIIWTPLAITVAAQLGVAPLLLTNFGRLGLVSIPANLLVGWAAGLVMMWGLTVGVIAGLVPDVIAEVIQFPVVVLLWWLKLVAAHSARWPVPVLTLTPGLWVLGSIGTIFAFSKNLVFRVFLVGLCIGQLMLLIPHPPAAETDIGHAVYLPAKGDDPSVLIVRSDATDRVVSWVVQSRIVEIDIVIFEQGDRGASSLSQALQNVVQVDTILAPSQHRVVGAHRIVTATSIQRTEPIEIIMKEQRLEIMVDGRLI